MSNHHPTEQQEAPQNVLEARARQLRERLTGAEVKSAKEQRLLEATKVHIDRYQEVVYEHEGDGTITKGPDGRPIEKSSTELHELLIRKGDPHLRETPGRLRRKGKIIGPNSEYDPHGALICAQVLSERLQGSVKEKQDAHAGDLEATIQVFHDTKAESEILFQYGKGRQYREMPVPRTPDPTHPDLRALEAGLEAYQRNNRRAERGVGVSALGIIERSKTVPQNYRVPEDLAREKIVEVIDFYTQKMVQLDQEVQGTTDPQKAAVLGSERQSIREFLDKINGYTDNQGHYIPEDALFHLERQYSATEMWQGALVQDPSTGQKVLDTHHLRRLQEIQTATVEFVRERQARVLGAQQVAADVLSDNNVSGFAELQELAFYQEQYQAHEKKWLKEMGGDREELQRRIAQWQRWGEKREQVAVAVAAEREGTNIMEQIVRGLLEAKTPEEIAAMKSRVEVLEAVVKILKQAGLKPEQLQVALGIAPERAEAVAPTVVLTPEQAAEQARWIAQIEGVRELFGDPDRLNEVFEELMLKQLVGGPGLNYDEAHADAILALLSSHSRLTADNPLINKSRLVAALQEAQQAGATDLGREALTSHLAEIFPNIERAKPDDISAVVLRPTVERVIPAPARAGVEKEPGGIYLSPEDVGKLLKLIAELPGAIPRRNREESAGDFKGRLDEALAEGGGLYNYLAENLGESGATVARRAGAQARSLSLMELFALIFQQVIADLAER